MKPLQQASPAAGAREAPEPGQPHRLQDPGRVVVLARAGGEAKVPRPRESGKKFNTFVVGIDKLFYRFKSSMG